MTLTPAYGRDYKSKKAAVAAFKANRDFIIHDITSPWDGKYASMTDLYSQGLRQVQIRYNRRRSVCVAPVEKEVTK